MGLRTLFDSVIQNTVEDDQGTWRQFVLDHLDYIAHQSQSFLVDETVMNRYRYDMRLFLKENLNRHQDMLWVVQILNDVPTEFDFHGAMTLIVPTDDLLVGLYRTYRTQLANAK